MERVLFIDKSEPVEAEVTRLSANTVQIVAEVEPNTSGFQLVTESGSVYGIFDEYTTLYRDIEGGFILSNDGSVYVEPEPTLEPEPYVPSLEEVQEMKVGEMNVIQQTLIQNGLNVTLSDGTIEHFTLTEHDQTSLMGLQSQVVAGEALIPWHTSDESEHCKFYSNADMALITSAAMAYVTWHVTYFRDLRIYIRSLETAAEVEAVYYGMDIPETYRSEPLRAMMAAQQS